MTVWICADCGDGRCDDCVTPRCDHDCQGLNDIQGDLFDHVGARCPGRVVAYADGRTGRCLNQPGHEGQCA